MTRTRLVVVATVVLALTACSSGNAPFPTGEGTPAATPTATPPNVLGAITFDGSHVDVDTWARAASEPGIVIIDVRTYEEYWTGYIPGAVNIDVSAPGFAESISALDPDVSYAVYCRSGNRSRVAIEQMATLGYYDTLGLEGGITAWISVGNAVEYA